MTSDANVASGVSNEPGQNSPAPQSQKPFAVAKIAPQTIAPSVAPAAPDAPPQQNNETSPSPPPSLTAQQAMQMYLPTEDASPALALVTGSPEPGAIASIPAGAHLEDGDYVSSKHGLMWGELRIKISVRGGQITGVQALQFPDHRSQSLYLSQMAIPILGSEVIKSQKSQVDVVSSATDTSYTFQDAVADAIIKATRG
ncbi:MAG: FMN-binding protein [Rhizomicrobium sp.]